jgi:hypothetical protein
MAGISDDVENLRVNRADFMRALDDVQPAFGVSEEELQQVIQNGIIRYHSSVDVIVTASLWLAQLVKLSDRNICEPASCLWNKSVRQRVHHSSASFCMARLDLAKRPWQRPSPRRHDSRSSN